MLVSKERLHALVTCSPGSREREEGPGFTRTIRPRASGHLHLGKRLCEAQESRPRPPRAMWTTFPRVDTWNWTDLGPTIYAKVNSRPGTALR